MCAGSIHTPQIMQLSGIGPADQLRDMGVDVKADLPGVGQNMIVSSASWKHHICMASSLWSPWARGRPLNCQCCDFDAGHRAAKSHQAPRLAGRQ